MATLYTFGDSILDCAGYNHHGAHPAGLIVRNDDTLFPEFAGRDLASVGAFSRTRTRGPLAVARGERPMLHHRSAIHDAETSLPRVVRVRSPAQRTTGIVTGSWSSMVSSTRPTTGVSSWKVTTRRLPAAVWITTVPTEGRVSPTS